MVDGQDAPREPGRVLLGTWASKETPGGARSGAPWAPNDQDDIGDNTQHILPPLPSLPHKVSLSSSTYNTSKPRKHEASVA